MKNRSKVIQQTSIIVLSLFMILSFQNCSKFELNSGGSLSLASKGEKAVRIPASDKVDPSGITSNAYDACIFYKNPVAQAQSPLSLTNRSSLASAQTFCVKLTGTTNSTLSNNNISVQSINGTAVNTSQNLRQDIAQDTTNATEQLMAFYWANRFQEYIEARTGKNYLKNKNVKIIADDTITGWSSSKNSIHLAKTNAANSVAFNGGVIIHLLAQAHIHHATNGDFNNIDASTHKACGQSKYGCCTSSNGCARAIASGVGDYLAGVMFPDSLGLGEHIKNSTDGLGFCSFSRNLASHSSSTAEDAHKACESNNNGAGQVNALGTVYASIWWQLRDSNNSAEIDLLFMEHLKELAPSDTFAEAKSKIVSLDAKLFNSKHIDSIQQEFQKRGL